MKNCSYNENLRRTRVTHLVFSTIVAIPTFIIYCILLYVLNKKSNRRKYGYAFFRLFSIVSGTLVWYFPYDILAFRTPNAGFWCEEITGLFEEPGYALTAPYSLFVYAYFVAFYANAAISCNRMTCVLFPMHHRQMWDRNMKYVTLIIFVLPIATVWNVALGKTFIAPNEELGSLMAPVKLLQSSWLSTSFLIMIVAVGCSGFILICTIITFFALVVQRRRDTHFNSTEQKKAMSAEVSLLFVGTVMAASTLLVGVSFAWFYFTLYVVRDRNDDSPMFYRFIATDVQAISAPWLLVLVCKQVREDVLTLFTRWLPCCDQSRLFVPVRVTTQNASSQN
ncbi:unnamed protein product [Auanema sp. JU1783]|nr:unnamed protein product [Auanema sp. JU1783]